MATIEDILLEFQAEGERQDQIGWTPEHDKEHGMGHLTNLVQDRLPLMDFIAGEPATQWSRKDLIQAGALIAKMVLLSDTIDEEYKERQ